MEIIINGKITELLEPRVGHSKKGNKYVSQTIIVDDKNGERYAIAIFGETFLQKLQLRVGTVVSCTCKMGSTEWKGKWYTMLNLDDIIIQGKVTTQNTQDKFNINEDDKIDVNTLPF